MQTRNFTVTVKERDGDEPCFLVFETDDNIGLGSKALMHHLRDGTGLAEAQDLARRLNAHVIKVSVS